MKSIQDSIFKYAQSNKYFFPMIKVAHILAVIYPIYLLVTEITFLSVIWQYVRLFSSIMYIAYYIGTILCFASNRLIPLDIAYGCMTFSYILDLQYGITLNRLVYICFYGLITSLCIVATKNSSQWNKLKEATLNNVTKNVATNTSTCNNDELFCSNCGKKIYSKMNFCNHCGNQIN